MKFRTMLARRIACIDHFGTEATVEEHVTEVRAPDGSGGWTPWMVERRRFTLNGRPVNPGPDGTFQTVDPPERLLRPLH